MVLLILRITLQLPFQNSLTKQIYSIHAGKQVTLFLLLFLDYMTDPQWGNTFIITFDIGNIGSDIWHFHSLIVIPDNIPYSPCRPAFSTIIDSVSRDCWGSVSIHYLKSTLWTRMRGIKTVPRHHVHPLPWCHGRKHPVYFASMCKFSCRLYKRLMLPKVK